MPRSSNAVSENSIVFFEGGHDHDGISSSLIDTEQYSIYDFIVGKTGSNARQIRQQRNFDNLKTVISNIVINDVLGPSGIRLLPNSVQSVHIAAGAITANELAANIILVNNLIRSNNFDGTIASNGIITSSGTAGWAITYAGSAVFDAASIRGAITASSISINANNFWNSSNFALGGNTGIYTSNGVVRIGTSVIIEGTVVANSILTPGVNIYSNGVLAANNFTIYANGAIVNNNFSVNANGSLIATNVDITGKITATSGSISGDLVVGGTIDSSDINGVNITGVTISGSSLTVGDRILLPVDGGQILLGTASGGSATQCTIFAGGSQGLYIDTSGSGSTWIAGQSLYVNLQQFTSARTIVGLDTSVGSGTTLVVSAGQVYRTSSKRELKENIQDFNDIALIDALRPRTFTWKVPPSQIKEETEEERVRRESSVNVGFIAEEVEEASNGLLSVYNYEEGGQGEVEMYKHLDILALSVANIQDLRRRIEALENQLGYNS